MRFAHETYALRMSFRRNDEGPKQGETNGPSMACMTAINIGSHFKSIRHSRLQNQPASPSHPWLQLTPWRKATLQLPSGSAPEEMQVCQTWMMAIRKQNLWMQPQFCAGSCFARAHKNAFKCNVANFDSSSVGKKLLPRIAWREQHALRAANLLWICRRPSHRSKVPSVRLGNLVCLYIEP
jgi:hypothetical protein